MSPSVIRFFTAFTLILVGIQNESFIGSDIEVVHASEAPRQSTSSNRCKALADTIANRREKVAEFSVIREAAQQLGLRVWLFGGTAAGFAHYVKWDMERIAGDTRYIESRFDYDFTNIYRSTQDADLVVDGSIQDAEQLEKLIKQKLSYLQGSKDDWEIRLLRTDRGEKQALLNNPDFLNQHTDSNSTGMIELTDPHSGEGVVRDLRDWKNTHTPQFLLDVAEGKLHFYFSPTHAQTTRYRLGLNPPIFSVIRYLTKAFQYELEMRPDDLEEIQKLIDAFDPASDLTNSQAMSRIEKIGSRLILHASNSEYAWNTLERLGLRKKLIAISDPEKLRSMAWWLNKEPLRAKPIGQGNELSLQEILVSMGVDPNEAVFSHETSDFLAWESINRDTTGRPNVLISRENIPGESASNGDGFYTALGLKGARGTGFTVRFKADLQSKEGVDFLAFDDHFIWLNRSSIRVISESIEFDFLEYFKMLSQGKKLDKSERGMLEKFTRRSKIRNVDSEQEREVTLLVRSEIDAVERGRFWNEGHPVLQEWFRFSIASNYPEFAAQLVKIANDPNWRKRVGTKTSSDLDAFIATHILTQPYFSTHREWVQQILNRGMADLDLAEHVLSKPYWGNRDKWIQTLINRGTANFAMAYYVLPSIDGLPKPEWIDALLRHKDNDSRVLKLIQSFPFGPEKRRWIETLVRRQSVTPSIVIDFLSRPEWTVSPELVQFIVDHGDTWQRNNDANLAEHVLSKPYWSNHPEWIEVLVRRNFRNPRRAFLDELLSLPHWKDHPKLREACDGRAPTIDALNNAFIFGFTFAPKEKPLSSCESLLESRNKGLGE